MLIRRPVRLAAAASALAAILVCATAQATVVVALSRAEMARRADLIVRASVLGHQSRWNEDGSQIITLTELRVTRWIKGNATSSTLVLRQLGGTVGDTRSHIAGDPQLGQGDDVVLFLRRGDQLGGRAVVYLYAMAQSAFHVTRSRSGALRVQRDLEGLTFAVRDGEQLRLVEPAAEPGEALDTFLAELASLVAGGR